MYHLLRLKTKLRVEGGTLTYEGAAIVPTALKKSPQTGYLPPSVLISHMIDRNVALEPIGRLEGTGDPLSLLPSTPTSNELQGHPVGRAYLLIPQ